MVIVKITLRHQKVQMAFMDQRIIKNGHVQCINKVGWVWIGYDYGKLVSVGQKTILQGNIP